MFTHENKGLKLCDNLYWSIVVQSGTSAEIHWSQGRRHPIELCRVGESLPDTPREAVARVLVAWLSRDIEINMLDHVHATGLPGCANIVKLSHGHFGIIIN